MPLTKEGKPILYKPWKNTSSKAYKIDKIHLKKK